MAYGVVKVVPGGFSTDLRRPVEAAPGYSAAEIETARDAVVHGRRVVLRRNWMGRLGRQPGIFVFLAAAASLFFEGARLAGAITTAVTVALTALLILLPETASQTRQLDEWAESLQGTRMSRAGSPSAELWTRAVGRVGEGDWPESELPELHSALLELAQAEADERVALTDEGRVLALSRGGGDDATRFRKVKQAGIEGLLAELGARYDRPYLENRWGQDQPREELACPNDLR